MGMAAEIPQLNRIFTTNGRSVSIVKYNQASLPHQVCHSALYLAIASQLASQETVCVSTVIAVKHLAQLVHHLPLPVSHSQPKVLKKLPLIVRWYLLNEGGTHLNKNDP